MKPILTLVAVLAIGAAAYFGYKKYIEKQADVIIQEIEHDLIAADEFVFSRDNMKFSEIIKYDGKMTSWVKYSFSWEASVPFGFKAKDLDLDYNSTSKKLKVKINRLRFFPLSLSKMKAEEVDNHFYIIDPNRFEGPFWENAPKRTEKLVNKEYKDDPALVNSAKEIAANSIQVKITEILQKLDVKNIDIDVEVGQLLMYKGETL